MANDCYNDATFYGHKDTIARIREHLTNADGSVSVVNLVPEEGEPNLEWRLDHWGVRSADYFGEFPDQLDDPRTLLVRYETPWGPLGHEFWEQVTRDYHVSVCVTYREDNMGFMGVSGYFEFTNVYDWSADFPEFPEGIDENDRDALNEADEKRMQEIWEQIDDAEAACEAILGEKMLPVWPKWEGHPVGASAS